MAYFQCMNIGGGTGDVADVKVNGTSVIDPVTKIAEITSYEEVTESEYEAIPVAERESNGIAYFIKDLNNESVQGYPPLIYSDEEREIGVWRDGKPLYQKTLVMNNLNLNTSGTAVDITSLGVDMCCPMYEGSYYIVSGVERSFARLEYQQPNEVYLYPAVNRTGTTSFITLQYTKTTDVAGSGEWAPSGARAVHYSTNEQVIGTWIDGKPLYEKTIVYTPSGTMTGSTTIATIANAKVMRITEATGYNATNNRGYSLPDVRNNGGTKFTYDDGDVVIETINDSWSSDWTFYVTVQYTKTTD